MRAHLRFRIINLVTRVSTVAFFQHVKAEQNQGFCQVVESSGNDGEVHKSLKKTATSWGWYSLTAGTSEQLGDFRLQRVWEKQPYWSNNFPAQGRPALLSIPLMRVPYSMFPSPFGR